MTGLEYYDELIPAPRGRPAGKWIELAPPSLSWVGTPDFLFER
jgi:hypothetical protein